MQGYGMLAVMPLFKFGAEEAFCSTYEEVWGKLNDGKKPIGEHWNIFGIFSELCYRKYAISYVREGFVLAGMLIVRHKGRLALWNR